MMNETKTEMFEIYINYPKFYNMIKYMSSQVPRVGEIVHMPHWGGYVVKQVAYRISDTSDDKRVMWVELNVEEYKGEEK